MDKQAQPKSLVSIRTFAKDLAAKKHKTSDTPVSPSGVQKTDKVSPVVAPSYKSKPAPVYSSPRWTKTKPPEPKPVPKPPEPKLTPKPPKPEPVPEPPKDVPTPPKENPKLDKPEISKKEKVPASNQGIEGIGESGMEATILTDTKSKSFRLFPAIGLSLKNWFKSINEKYFTKKPARYTVADTGLRKGVIQQATSKTGKSETFDHQTLQERIRARQNRVEPDLPQTIWTANTEPGYALLNAPDEEVSAIVKTETASLKNQSEVPLVQEKIIVTEPIPPVETQIVAEAKPEPVFEELLEVKEEEAEQEKSIPTSSEVEAPTITPVVVEEEIIEKIPEEDFEDIYNEEELVEVEVPFETKTKNRTFVTKLKPARLTDWLFSTSTNTLSLGASGVILSLLLVTTAGYLIWSKYKPIATSAITQETEMPTALEAPLQPVYTDNLSRENLFRAITENQKSNEYDVFYLILVSSPTGNDILPAATVINSLELSLKPAFINSVSEVYFGSLRQSNPFIILDVSDKQMALGGMLAWENSILEDLKPMLKAFDTNFATASSSKGFKDEVVIGNDTRIIKDQSGKTLLTYVITKNNKVLIATAQNTLMSLLNLVK